MKTGLIQSPVSAQENVIWTGVVIFGCNPNQIVTKLEELKLFDYD